MRRSNGRQMHSCHSPLPESAAQSRGKNKRRRMKMRREKGTKNMKVGWISLQDACSCHLERKSSLSQRIESNFFTNSWPHGSERSSVRCCRSLLNTALSQQVVPIICQSHSICLIAFHSAWICPLNLWPVQSETRSLQPPLTAIVLSAVAKDPLNRRSTDHFSRSVDPCSGSFSRMMLKDSLSCTEKVIITYN